MSSRVISAAIIIAMVGWIFPAFQLFTPTYASQLNSVSATASSSAPSIATNYMVRFTTVNAIGQAVTASTTRITFDPQGGLFDLTALTNGNVTVSRLTGGLTQVAAFGSCSGAVSEMYVSQVVAGASDYVELLTCPGDIIAAGTITVNIAGAHAVNPSASGSYVVRINGTMADSADTRVAIINQVAMTGIVDTNLTFTIATVASSSPVNGDTTSTSSTATAIGFGTLSVGTSSVAAQDVSVSTNALNGFSVTVTENQDLTSANGATINAFKDGNAVTGSPTAWTAPVGTIGSPNTYGHMGITSEDVSLPGDDFGSQLYAGLSSTSTRTILFHTGPADGTTANIGKTRVGFRIQVSALQEAASDYTNQITYVCTSTF
ncbi:MAG: hypothetical protein A2845_05055 [Candidatus Lloydbacteria bacterium RIFCSPHIGHO2_01_FULL_49_22]|uniref:Uncharacterized protein n=1 Tax=Candidatus Lloydbacteria bacterium RIFCSPHIGHO2_01_FULL_49_22 TaxID=1798658 RepID=A0A1G2CVZ9_9BACT|nr:MAG: hypothetical protein A2845_05055 [Candidatus Lloydbacteria bacterium RIFCSPHIGHO2_01_FULL_49_22]OGZ09496.1 MAG: hypothetical protein A3C14_01610 [Candidatus Lloydbacteria bacterium RIFCSPHIGHO2_02_FULL_50_18]